MTKQLILAALVSITLAACGGKTEDAAKPAETPAPAAAPATPAEPVAAAVDESSPPKHAPVEGEPAECESYVKRVNACVEKAQGANPAGAEAFRQQLETTRAQWAQIPDKTALAAACKQAEDAFAQTAAMLKCE
ncbi:DUF5339 family protein [Dokdonella sp. MW10]|uniref:DUF5339 family protein n=1 Tax=Dokdonella sp. MW10 TaxID=2992926 RepID=UPI003F7F2BD6